MKTTVEIDLQDIAHQVAMEGHDDAFEFINNVDLHVADTDFALRVAKHFVQIVRECQEEDISEHQLCQLLGISV